LWYPLAWLRFLASLEAGDDAATVAMPAAMIRQTIDHRARRVIVLPIGRSSGSIEHVVTWA